MAVSKVILNGTTLIDVTQKTVAAANLLSGETALKNDGTDVIGTYTPPASITVDPLSVTQNGTYTATTGHAYSPVTVNVSGGGGLEYEEGTYTPTSDIAKPTISFTNSHTNPPILISLCDATETEDYVTNSWKKFAWLDAYQMRNSPMPVDTTINNYASAFISARTSSTAITNWTYNIEHPFSDTGSTNNTYYRYWVTNSGFTPSNTTTRYYRSGRTYKWIAVWNPTT